jgi:hypothetical protein
VGSPANLQKKAARRYLICGNNSKQWNTEVKMNTNLNFIWVLTVIWLAWPAFVFGDEPAPVLKDQAEPLKPCEKRVSLSAYSYWYDEVFFGFEEVKEKNGIRTGRVNNLYHDCFSVKIKDLKGDRVRIQAYKSALHELLRYKMISIQLGKEDPNKIFRQVKSVTGLDFKTKKDIQKWWYENRDYLLWSSKAGHLKVDEQAKADKNPVSKEYHAVRAHRYWFSLLVGRIKNETRNKGTVKADMWTYHGYQGVTIPVKELEDVGAREQGYLMATGEIIHNFLTPDNKNSHPYYMDKLQQWTGLPYSDAEKWQRWWKKYRKRLTFSAKENRLLATD